MYILYMSVEHSKHITVAIVTSSTYRHKCLSIGVYTDTTLFIEIHLLGHCIGTNSRQV